MSEIADGNMLDLTARTVAAQVENNPVVNRRSGSAGTHDHPPPDQVITIKQNQPSRSIRTQNCSNVHFLMSPR